MPPPLTAAGQRELFARLLDRAHMQLVFARELPRLCDTAIAVHDCRASPHRGGAGRGDAIEVVYGVAVAVAGAPPRDYLLLGTAPATADDAALPGAAADHPWAAPFRRLATFVPDLGLALRLFPLDPALPALVGLSGGAAGGALAPYLRECRDGTAIDGTALERTEAELKQYKPWKRAVLRVTCSFARAPARAVYVKVFADDRGADNHRELAALWSAAATSTWLRMPEPLGYDAAARMLVFAEVPGERALTLWIRCVRKGRPLPAGVTLVRVQRGLEHAARALAELQRAPVQPRTERPFAAELERVQHDRDLLPATAGLDRARIARADALLHALRALAPAHEQLLPAHGGFRHQQIVGDEDRLCIVDWDGLCRADPALDAGNLLAHLRAEPAADAAAAAASERLAAAFRREFLRCCPYVAARQLARYEGLAHTERLLRRCRHALRSDGCALEFDDLAGAAEQQLLAAARGDGA